jgi:soluble lytic murein transglycosylase-like protein
MEKQRATLWVSKLQLLVLLTLLIIILSAIPPDAVAGPIYVYKKGGVVRFSNKPPPAGIEAKVFTARSSSFSIYKMEPGPRRALYPGKYRSVIQAASSKYGVEKSLIQAVIHAESAFKVQAVSPKGALGLMQIMPSNLRKLGVKDPFSVHQNIHGGTKLLSQLIRKYGGDLRYVLAAYNAGEAAVRKYGGVPPYRETQNYVGKVLKLKSRYGAT